MSEALTLVTVTLDDPRLEPMLAELSREYGERYGENGRRYVADDHARDPRAFDPPDGALLLLLLADTPVAGGGFIRRDFDTAEIKRV